MFITEVEFPFHNLRHIPMRLSKNLYHIETSMPY